VKIAGCISQFFGMQKDGLAITDELTEFELEILQYQDEILAVEALLSKTVFADDNFDQGD
jgi:hypothetical protein